MNSQSGKKATRVGQMKNIAHLRGLAKKVCSRQQLICPFVDNATIHASVDLMNSLTTQTVSGHRFFRPNFPSKIPS